MSRLYQTLRPRVAGAAATFLIFALAVWLPVVASTVAHATGTPGEALRATSVCDAQRLKAMKEEDSHLQIEIPPEFDKQFPTLSACESHDAAWDPEAPGPMQPIPFSHKHHAGQFEIDCQYCHSGSDESRVAGVPSVELCMGCHMQFPPEYDELEGIQILKDHWEKQTPIEWEQVHRMPEYVKFRHNRHVAAGLACQDCHGPVETMDKLYLVPDTHVWPWLMPTKKLEMGWCINCHRDNDQQASQDCLTCHY